MIGDPWEFEKRSEKKVVFKSFTDINECLLELVRSLFAVDPAWKYTRRAETSNLVIESEESLERLRAEKYPCITIDMNSGRFSGNMIGDKVAQIRSDSTALRMCNMGCDGSISVKSHSKIECDQLAVKVAFFLFSFKDIIRSKFDIDLSSCSWSSPRLVSQSGGKSLYTVVISLGFMVSCKWADKEIAERLNQILTRFTLEDDTTGKFQFGIVTRQEPESTA
ncbi:MAG: hypothetical protein WCY49_07405 [Anaerovoracaceae bacterium]